MIIYIFSTWILTIITLSIGFLIGFWKKNDKEIDKTFSKSLENKVKTPIKKHNEYGIVDTLNSQQEKELKNGFKEDNKFLEKATGIKLKKQYE